MLLVRVWYLHAPRLRIEDIHLRCKTGNKCLNVREEAKMVKRNEDGHISFLAFL